MNLHEVLELIQLRRFERDPVQRILNRTHLPADFREVARRKLPLQPGREHFHYMLMRAGLNGRQVLAVLVGFAVLYATVGLIGARANLPDWVLFAPWITLLGLQYYIIKGLAVLIRHRRWKGRVDEVVVPAIPADAHVDEPQREAA